MLTAETTLFMRVPVTTSFTAVMEMTICTEKKAAILFMAVPEMITLSAIWIMQKMKAGHMNYMAMKAMIICKAVSAKIFWSAEPVMIILAEMQETTHIFIISATDLTQFMKTAEMIQLFLAKA